MKPSFSSPFTSPYFRQPGMAGKIQVDWLLGVSDDMAWQYVIRISYLTGNGKKDRLDDVLGFDTAPVFMHQQMIQMPYILNSKQL